MGVTGIKLGGFDLADPAYEADGFTLEAVSVGAVHDMSTGAKKYDLITTRYRFNLKWKMITAAERVTIRTQAEVITAQAFITPDGDTYSVFVVPDSWRENFVEGGDLTKYYNCELQLVEVA